MFGRISALLLVGALFVFGFPGSANAELDGDADGVPDSADNCLAEPNPDQLDVDYDGYGSACDADYNNDGIVGAPDFNQFKPAFGSALGDALYDVVLDHNGDGVIGVPDANVLRRSFSDAPGPSGLACAGSVPCTEGPVLEDGYVPGSDGVPVFTTYEVHGDHVLHQGDMHFDLATLRAYQEEVAAQMGSGQVPQFNFTNDTWPNGEVVYDPESIDAFDGNCQGTSAVNDLNGNGMWDPGEICNRFQDDEIRQAIVYWNASTDIVLRPKTVSDDHWFRFEFDPKEKNCKSEVGYVKGWVPIFFPSSTNPQRITLGPACAFSSVVHEIGHTVGLRHEQSRHDRDQFVEYLSWNVESGKGHNFKRGGASWGPYDYMSIMHYGANSFGIDDAAGNTLPTLEPLVDLPLGILGQRGFLWQPRGLSTLDILGANALARKAQTGFMPAADRILYDDPVGTFPTTGALPDEMRLGYVDTDAYPDLVGFRPGASSLAGEVVVARGNSSGGFGATQVWNPAFCHDTFSCELGDVTGDGLDDLVSFDSYQGDVVVAPSNGSSFVGSALWQVADRMPGGELRLVDVNDDCVEDAILLDFYDGILKPSRVQIHVALSGQAGFTPFVLVGDIEARQVMVADAPFGTQARLISANDDGDVEVRTLASAYVGNPTLWAEDVCEGDVECKLADVTGDGLVDLIAENPGADHPLRRLRILISDGTAFRTDRPVHHDMDCLSPIGCLYGDLDGDGAGDDVVDPLGSPYEDSVDREVYTFVDPVQRYESFSTIPTAGPTCTPAPPPPNASPWVQVTDWPAAQIVGTKSHAYALRANEAAAGHTLLRHEADDSWTTLHGNVHMAAATDDELFVLTSEGSPAYRVNANGSLTSIGGSFIHIEGGTSGLVGVESAGVIKSWDCFCGGTYRPGWTTLPDAFFYPAGDDVMVVGGYTLPANDDVGAHAHLFMKGVGTVVSYDYEAMSYNNELLGPPYVYFDPIRSLHAGDNKLYRTLISLVGGAASVQEYTGTQHLYAGGTWVTIGTDVGEVVASPQTGNLYRLSGDKSEIHRYEGVAGQWTKIGGAAERLYFGSGKLFASSPGSGALFRLYVE